MISTRYKTALNVPPSVPMMRRIFAPARSIREPAAIRPISEPILYGASLFFN